MSILTQAIHHPRKLWLRRALFQVHLWAGVLLSVYIVVIALTGSILVFEDEFTRTTLPSGLSSYHPAATASIPGVLAAFARAYPGGHITNLILPSEAIPAFQLQAIDADRHPVHLVADPGTARMYSQPRTWVEVVHDLHVYLLLGHAYGVQVNGAGAAILLLLAISGLILWWPGIAVWTRGLHISFRNNWRRINFDAHSAIGFWTLALIVWWAFSGIYFAWYKQVAATVNAISPLDGMVQPKLPVLLASPTQAPVESILQAIHQVSPQGRLYGLSDLSRAPIYAEVDLRALGDFSHRDIITLDPATAKVLTVWHYGRNHSLGDWILWSMHPLHFGTLWGLPIKILWALLGVALAALSVTGLLMYWNRYLRHRLG
jgi:uncharacterized iron-regulated membrane protein